MRELRHQTTICYRQETAFLFLFVLVLVLVLVLLICSLVGCDEQAVRDSPGTDELPSGVRDKPAAEQDKDEPVERPPVESAAKPSPPIVAAARDQIGKTTTYDGAYVGLVYPGGDVPIERGVCTDVVIRALRTAHGTDLQKLVHEDMKTNFAQYPTIWGLTRPDRNIDHRRVPNLQTYFKRAGYHLGISDNPNDYQPGDLVTCTVGGNRPHIMVVSDKKNSTGVPLVIHNIGRGTQEEDRLFEFPLTGHYRVRSADDSAPG